MKGKNLTYLRCIKEKNKEYSIHYSICLNRKCRKRNICKDYCDLRNFLISKLNGMEGSDGK